MPVMTETPSSLNRIAIGTAQFGLDYGIGNRAGRLSVDEARKIIERARSNGIGTLDTAMAYGDSEQRLGEIGIHGWQVVSKLPAIPEPSRDPSQWMTDSLHKSLERLRIGSLYGLLLHRPQQLWEPGGDRIYQVLQEIKSGGLVRNIGISIYEPSELEALSSRYQFDLIQAPFSVVDRRLIDTGQLSRLSEQTTELHVRSIFLQGLLLMRPGDLPPAFARWVPLWAAWHEWLAGAGLTPLQACVRYALSFPAISKVIVGVDALRQLDEILDAGMGPALEVDPRLQSHDVDLLNPSRWPSR